MARIALDALRALTERALMRPGASAEMAAATARALLYAEAHGLASDRVTRAVRQLTELAD